jgi:hypothetical protein
VTLCKLASPTPFIGSMHAALDAISIDGLDATHTEHPPIAGWICTLYPRLRSRHFLNGPSQRLHNQGTARSFHRVQRWLAGLSKHAPVGLSEAGADGQTEASSVGHPRDGYLDANRQAAGWAQMTAVGGDPRCAGGQDGASRDGACRTTVGSKKLRLQAFFTATAMNILRACAWMAEGVHAWAPISRFAKLAAVAKHAAVV